MAVFRGFPGREITLPDSLVYEPQQHLWLKNCPEGVEIGLSHAGIHLVSGLVVLTFVAREGQTVQVDDPLLAVETYKAMFQIDSPLAGQVVRLNRAVEGNRAEFLDKHHYEETLVIIDPQGQAWESRFLSADEYAEALEKGVVDYCGAGARAHRQCRSKDPS